MGATVALRLDRSFDIFGRAVKDLPSLRNHWVCSVSFRNRSTHGPSPSRST